MAATCKICNESDLLSLIKIPGIHPSLFLSPTPNDPESGKIPYGLDQCRRCSHLQQGVTPPLESLQPKFLWQRFREPEQHLDALAIRLRGLLPEGSVPKIFGLSWQDDSLLERLTKLGTETQVLDSHQDLGVPKNIDTFGIESLQYYFSEQIAENTAEDQGQADCVIARDILEHAFNPVGFLRNLGALVKDDGLIVIEVPGSQELLQNRRYWLLWEHHVSHFTQTTLRLALANAGLTLVWDTSLDLDAGEYLVAIARKSPGVKTGNGAPQGFQLDSKSETAQTLTLAQKFVADYPASKKHIQSQLQEFKDRPLFFFGANHVSHWWIQVFGTERYFKGLIDDAPDKQGLHLPGTGLQIRESQSLQHEIAPVCLHLFGPVTSAKILQKIPWMQQAGGILLNAETLYAKV